MTLRKTGTRAAKKSTAKRGTAKRRTAKRGTAKKGVVKKTAAKKRAAKKSATKKSALKKAKTAGKSFATLQGAGGSASPMGMKSMKALVGGGTVYRALCTSGDFEGGRHTSEPAARAEARGHNIPGHVVKVVAEQEI